MKAGALLQEAVQKAESWQRKVASIVPFYGAACTCTTGQLEQLLCESQVCSSLPLRALCFRLHASARRPFSWCVWGFSVSWPPINVAYSSSYTPILYHNVQEVPIKGGSCSNNMMGGEGGAFFCWDKVTHHCWMHFAGTSSFCDHWSGRHTACAGILQVHSNSVQEIIFCNYQPVHYWRWLLSLSHPSPSMGVRTRKNTYTDI